MNQTQTIVKAIPLTSIDFKTGTWVVAVGTNQVSMDKTATDEASQITIPISMEGDSTLGNVLKKIEIPISIATAALDAISVKLYKNVYSSGSSVASEVTVTDDLAVTVTTAFDIFTVTVGSTDDNYDEGNFAYNLVITADAAVTSVLKVATPMVTYQAIT